MKKWFNSKEMRDLVFIAIAIFMTILICVTTIANANMFGVVVSIVLLALLCVGLGYSYCKNEDKISFVVEKVEKPKKEKAKSDLKIPNIDLEKLGLVSKKKEDVSEQGEKNSDVVVDNGKKV